MTQNVRIVDFVQAPCHMAIEYVAGATANLSVASKMAGSATSFANLENAVVALERALRETKAARREAKRLIRGWVKNV